MKQKTGLTSFKNKSIADLFAGTGVVSNHFRNLGAVVLSNDAELYSSVITHAVTCSTYNEKCKGIIQELQADTGTRVGFVTKNYSPHNENERMFFTVENAMRIDYLRWRLESMKENLDENDFKFILASLILSSDAVSNVPAVYGCYLKNFKPKANRTLELKPIHTNTEPVNKNSKTLFQDLSEYCLILY
jgi:adenine-specific DNA-methyltransferase